MIDFTGYDPIKWTLDFHQFLINNFKLIYQDLVAHDDLSEFNASDTDLEEIILDELLRYLLNNNLQLEKLRNNVSLNAKNSIFLEEYKIWSRGKDEFYFRKFCYGKKTNPEELKVMYRKDWEFLYVYYNEGFPIKDEFKSVFYGQPDAGNQLQKIHKKIDLLIGGVLSARELAEVYKDIDPVYYEIIINSDEYYTDLTGK